MNFDMTRPCAQCPFRHDMPGYLTEARVREITDALLHRDQCFPCHKTTVSVDGEDGFATREATDASQHCAGATIFLELQERPNQLMRIFERFGGYDRRKLDMNAPVFDNADWMAEHHRRATRR